jgi:hypothetical protein
MTSAQRLVAMMAFVAIAAGLVGGWTNAGRLRVRRIV